MGEKTQTKPRKTPQRTNPDTSVSCSQKTIPHHENVRGQQLEIHPFSLSGRFFSSCWLLGKIFVPHGCRQPLTDTSPPLLALGAQFQWLLLLEQAQLRRSPRTPGSDSPQRDPGMMLKTKELSEISPAGWSMVLIMPKLWLQSLYRPFKNWTRWRTPLEVPSNPELSVILN